jgi:esterase
MPVELAARRLGEGPPVLVLHGLLGQGRNWQAIAKRLARGRAVWLVDLRNHGASPWAEPMSYPAMVEDLVHMIEDRAGSLVAIVGHSMGGKAAMGTALMRPDLVSHLAVVDVAPVPYDHQVYAHYMAAMREVDPASLERRAEVEEALAEVDPDPRIRAFLASNIEADARGMRWAPNLDVLLRDLPEILDFPKAFLDRRFDKPTLFLLGERSDYLPPEDEAEARRLFPQATFKRIAGAGHWVHADQPQAVLEALDDLLPHAG